MLSRFLMLHQGRLAGQCQAECRQHLRRGQSARPAPTVFFAPDSGCSEEVDVERNMEQVPGCFRSRVQPELEWAREGGIRLYTHGHSPDGCREMWPVRKVIGGRKESPALQDVLWWGVNQIRLASYPLSFISVPLLLLQSKI